MSEHIRQQGDRCPYGCLSCHGELGGFEYTLLWTQTLGHNDLIKAGWKFVCPFLLTQIWKTVLFPHNLCCLHYRAVQDRAQVQIPSLPLTAIGGQPSHLLLLAPWSSPCHLSGTDGGFFMAFHHSWV